MRCDEFSKNLSAFLDNELPLEEHKKMELHIASCETCHKEAEELKVMVNIVANTPRLEAPTQLWEMTHKKIIEEAEIPKHFRLPNWSFVPVAAAVFALMLFFASNYIFFHQDESGEIPVAYYIQEHVATQSEYSLSIEPVSELTTMTQTEEDYTQLNDNISELELLMEVHYGIDATNGS
ncbi:hypothetical protein GF312_02510 [Candidatus Poribacteria bacterium]|nr:hypothetical protein [Candidatus Poribacteria bacterium]